MIVYFHRNPKTKEVFYVGIGIKKDRAYRFTKKCRNKFWHNYVSKHGLPEVEIVHEVETRAEVVALELKYISQFGRRCDGSGSLVNITLGGDGGALGVKQSQEQKEKIRSKLKGRKHSSKALETYKAAQNRPEVRAKQAIIKSDPIWLEKQRVAKLGKKQSPELILKRTHMLKGHPVSEETKKKISATNTGKIRTAEMRANYSKASKGRKPTAQATANKIAAQKKLVLNIATGIYYHGLQEAAESVPMNLNTLRSKMAGFTKNTTPFVYA